TLLMVHFLTALVLQFLSSCILFVYLAFILKVSLGNNIGLILLTLILGGISGLCIGMLTATFVKGEKKCDSILTVAVLGLSIFAGLMSIDVKILVDKYVPFINYINPACLITNSLYALYYYNTFNDYCLYTCLLAGISLVMIGLVLWKIRGEKYASL
ncbi:MAG: ABC transporter permease, partial [Anaeroplasmataceae bacterium]|nr:ABC transporter permease [Anaeroplasmataceae bacterium]